MTVETNKKPIKVTYPKFNMDEDNPYQEEMDKLIDISLAEAGTTRTRKNIVECLTKSLKSKYGITDKEELKDKVNKFMDLHGLGEENFDPLAIISKLTFGNLQTVNDISVDANANKSSTNTEGICAEAMLPFKKLVGYDYLYQTLKELYGKAEAKKCCASMYDLSLFLHDTTNILKPYCYCIDASKIVTEGRNFGQVHSGPAHRISTYVTTLGDTIREISFNIAGACAIGTFFLDIANLAIYRERITLDDLRNDRKVRKAVSNNMQQFIYTVNHYSRSAVESPFTNVSLFDREKLKNLISDDNYGWYFPKKAAIIEDNGLENTKEAFKDFVLDYIEELQEIYIDVFDAGDPLRNGLQFPFPVTTINLSTEKDENGKNKLILTGSDNKLLEYISHKDISKVNIYVAGSSKVASCCFAGDEIIKVYDKENHQILISIKDFVEKYQKDEGQITNLNDYLIDSLTQNNEIEKTTITGVLVKNNTFENLIEINITDNKIIRVTPDHILKVMNEETKEIEEITAQEFLNNKEKYLLPVL